MNDLLLAVLKALGQENIVYCLLRDCDQLDRFRDGGEVDLLVQASQLAQLHSLLMRLGFVKLQTWGHAPHHFFVAYDQASDCWLKLDVVTEIAYGKPSRALRTTLACNCLANRRSHGLGFIPSPEDELLTLLLHCVLDKGHFDPSRRQRLSTLREQVSREAYLSTLLASFWSPTTRWSQLAALIDTQNWTGLLAERQAVAAHLTGRDRVGVLGRQMRNRVLRRLDPWRRMLRPQVPMVAVLAPDGAGKSTLVAAIRRSFYLPVYPVYMGLYQKDSANSGRSRLLRLGFTGRLLTQWGRWLVARYNQGRGRLVVFDRYTYDSLLPLRQGMTWFKRSRRWLLAHACPTPDLTLILDAPGELLYARKGEHSPAILEHQRQAYLKLGANLPHTIVIDATRDAECVRREVMSLIWLNSRRRTASQGQSAAVQSHSKQFEVLHEN